MTIKKDIKMAGHKEELKSGRYIALKRCKGQNLCRINSHSNADFSSLFIIFLWLSRLGSMFKGASSLQSAFQLNSHRTRQSNVLQRVQNKSLDMARPVHDYFRSVLHKNQTTNRQGVAKKIIYKQFEFRSYREKNIVCRFDHLVNPIEPETVYLKI